MQYANGGKIHREDGKKLRGGGMRQQGRKSLTFVVNGTVDSEE